MSLTESLTVRILADSSELRRELGSVAAEVDSLQERLSRAGNAGRIFDESLSGVSSALRPLQQLSALLDRITQQVQLLSRQPITLNVRPALGALNQLAQAVQRTAMLIRSLSGGIQFGPLAVPMTGRVPGFAAGGMVLGPHGLDQVPARLTAGEFVLNREAVSALGQSFLERLNRHRSEGLEAQADAPISDVLRHITRASAPVAAHPLGDRTGSPAPHTTSISHSTTHFGGIEIHVREATDVDEMLLDLRRQGIGLRNRRG